MKKIINNYIVYNPIIIKILYLEILKLLTTNYYINLYQRLNT